MVGKLDDALRFQQTALSLRAQRQELLASNIANADTPNYKARDIDFSTALKNALANSGEPSAARLTTSAPAHLAGGNPNTLPDGTPVLYRNATQGNVDGNTVDADVERNQFTDNALRYEAGLTLIGAQIKNLLAAVQG